MVKFFNKFAEIFGYLVILSFISAYFYSLICMIYWVMHKEKLYQLMK